MGNCAAILSRLYGTTVARDLQPASLAKGKGATAFVRLGGCPRNGYPQVNGSERPSPVRSLKPPLRKAGRGRKRKEKCGPIGVARPLVLHWR